MRHGASELRNSCENWCFGIPSSTKANAPITQDMTECLNKGNPPREISSLTNVVEQMYNELTAARLSKENKRVSQGRLSHESESGFKICWFKCSKYKGYIQIPNNNNNNKIITSHDKRNRKN